MNENEIYVVKNYKGDNPLINKIIYLIESCYRDFHKKCFHNFKYESIYDIKLTYMTDNETNNLTISGKSICLYDLSKK